MTIPDFQSIMKPFLKFLDDGNEHSIGETVEHISEVFNLSSEERRQLLPSGNQEVIRNRVGWSRTHLGKSRLLESTRRGYFRITERGHDVLRKNPERIDLKFLEQFPEFVEFRNQRRPTQNKGSTQTVESTDTPEEALASAYQVFRKELEADLLEQVKNVTPIFFERLVVELLVSMGYGGSRQDAGHAVGQSDEWRN